MKPTITFDNIYELYLNQITDEMYVALNPEQAYEDMQGMLLQAIGQFRYPKVPLTVNLDAVDADGKPAPAFTGDVSQREAHILSKIMVGLWIDRQINTVRLTELQYTGNDAAVLNTASQLRALRQIKDAFRSQLEKDIKYYQFSTVDEKTNQVSASKLNLSGKGGTRNGRSR